MFIHEVAHRLNVVRAEVARGASIGEALDRIEDERVRSAATAFLVQAREELPKGSAAAVVRSAYITAREEGRF